MAPDPHPLADAARSVSILLAALSIGMAMRIAFLYGAGERKVRLGSPVLAWHVVFLATAFSILSTALAAEIWDHRGQPMQWRTLIGIAGYALGFAGLVLVTFRTRTRINKEET